MSQFIDESKSLVEHAKGKLLYHELAPIFELCTNRTGKKEAKFITELVHKFLDKREKTKVLDLGCGVGRISKRLASSGQFKVTGIDLSTDLIAEAAQQCEECNFIQQDMRSIFIDESFDVAICMWTTFNYLSTASDIHDFSHAVGSHLQSQGLLVLDLPNPNRLPSVATYSRTNENENFHLSIKIQKRLVGVICEGLYQYQILDKETGKTILFSDQELHRNYHPREVIQSLGQWFNFQAIYGDYDLQAGFEELTSDRAILCFIKSP